MSRFARAWCRAVLEVVAAALILAYIVWLIEQVFLQWAGR